jgi:serine/threonine protein kinase
MGQVFRATDTKLKRQVAIKILPPSLAADQDRLARFQREAEVLASLNHPHIAGIYGLEENDGVSALVMELVEGEDLSQRIARGPIPLDEALPIAKQIAEALEAAHEQGIIHRDLKPANIKVRADGTVKVLDFGLAKAMEPAGGSSPRMSLSPTMVSPAQMSAAGVILGTAAYMSPEQAKGRAVDKRADIWAFGVVVYEMLTGQGLFAAEDVSETLAAVLTRTVDLAALPGATPQRVRRLLERCLDRDPRMRLRDIGEARVEVDKTMAGANDAAPPTPSSGASPASSGRVVWISAFAVAMVVIVALAIPALRHLREATPPETRVDIVTPPYRATRIVRAFTGRTTDRLRGGR